MNHVSSPKKPLWKTKAVIFAIIFSCLFLVLFYLAVTNEPDYMPSQQNKHNSTSQTSIKTPQHESMQMSDEEMKKMSLHEHQ